MRLIENSPPTNQPTNNHNQTSQLTSQPPTKKHINQQTN